ncbi:hypothetical protein ES703_78552 [subsurface metagenome]
MTEAPAEPTLAAGPTKYPHWTQARAYLKKFLGRWRGWHSKSHLCAKCRYSASLDIIVIRLAPNIFEVRAYPPDGFIVGSLEEALVVQDFRAWIFVNDPRTRSITYFWGSQKDGLEHYKLVAKAIRHEGTLARANSYYRKLV